MVEHSVLNPDGNPTISLATAGEERRFDVREWEVAALGAVFDDAATTAVVTVYRAMEFGPVAALEVPATLTPGTPMTPAIDCAGIEMLVVRVTTAHAGKTARLSGMGKRTV